MIISAIVAYTKDKDGKQIIGKDNKLPWRIPKDMAWFKECTSGSAIVMGRKTFESIGRVLPNRDNIILSRNPDFKVKGAYVFADLDKALIFAAERNPEVFVIGGQQIYEQVIDRVDRIYVTLIKNNPGYEGDAFFPSWNRSQFKVIHREEIEDPKNGKVTFKIFQRAVYQKNAASEVDEGVAAAYHSGGVPYVI